MRTTRILVLALLPVLLVALPAMAADEGQTIPKLNTDSIINSTSPADLIPLTNGSGNLKGIHCIIASNALSRNLFLDFTLDGGATTTVQIESARYPLDSQGAATTGFIPFNLRFETSIKVVMRQVGLPGGMRPMTCIASWALD